MEKKDKKLFRMGVDYLGTHGQSIARNPIAHKLILNQALKTAKDGYRENLETQKFPIGVCRDHYEMNKP
jgi:hypothetical protein